MSEMLRLGASEHLNTCLTVPQQCMDMYKSEGPFTALYLGSYVSSVMLSCMSADTLISVFKLKSAE